MSRCLAAGVANAGQKEDCEAATTAFGTSCAVMGNVTACPAGCQDAIDTMYSDCGGYEEDGQKWDDISVTQLKPMIEQIKCAGAQQAMPAVFVAVAGIVGHFMN